MNIKFNQIKQLTEFLSNTGGVISEIRCSVTNLFWKVVQQMQHVAVDGKKLRVMNYVSGRVKIA